MVQNHSSVLSMNSIASEWVGLDQLLIQSTQWKLWLWLGLSLTISTDTVTVYTHCTVHRTVLEEKYMNIECRSEIPTQGISSGKNLSNQNWHKICLFMLIVIGLPRIKLRIVFCFVLFCLCGGPVTAPLLNLSRNLSSK